MATLNMTIFPIRSRVLRLLKRLPQNLLQYTIQLGIRPGVLVWVCRKVKRLFERFGLSNPSSSEENSEYGESRDESDLANLSQLVQCAFT